MITAPVVESMDASVLCWLATVSESGIPNVSPKEAFLHDGEDRILIANIASPKTVRNIRAHSEVCLSFVNVFTQRGHQITGKARILKSDDDGYAERLAKLTAKIGTTFKIISIIEITPTSVNQIIAPSYRLFPDSGPLDRIRESLKAYGISDYLEQVARSDSAGDSDDR